MRYQVRRNTRYQGKFLKALSVVEIEQIDGEARLNIDIGLFVPMPRKAGGKK